tara:strand:+ start:3413 stop:4030 length:618 start_codon:yes stop_codon:yes gene_type:complete
MSLGLPHDLSLSMTRRFKKVHRDYCLEETRAYYLDRKKWLPNVGSMNEKRLLACRFDKSVDQVWSQVSVVYDSRYQVESAKRKSFHREFNLRAINEIKSIPKQFWINLGRMNFEYEDTIGKIEPEERNDYFKWAYENWYHGWNRDVLEWVKGFHPGRWILMDMKRGEILEDIRDLEDWGAYTEERFIRNKDHIDDLLAGKSLYNR